MESRGPPEAAGRHNLPQAGRLAHMVQVDIGRVRRQAIVDPVADTLPGTAIPALIRGINQGHPKAEQRARAVKIPVQAATVGKIETRLVKSEAADTAVEPERSDRATLLDR